MNLLRIRDWAGLAGAVSAVAHGVRVLSYRPGSSTDPVGVSACEASSIAFESVEPFRLVRPYRGRRNFVGGVVVGDH